MLLESSTSIGERLSEAGTNTIVGMGTVFAALIVISLIIACFSIIPKIQAHFERKREEKHIIKTAPEPDVVTVDNDIEEVSYEDDTELVAVITAAIMAYMGDEAPVDGLQVRSIRKVNNKWRKA